MSIYRTRASGGTTWFVERQGEWIDRDCGSAWHKVGVVNFPGNDAKLPYHALNMDESLKGCFPSLAEAVAFLENHDGIEQETGRVIV